MAAEPEPLPELSIEAEPQAGPSAEPEPLPELSIETEPQSAPSGEEEAAPEPELFIEPEPVSEPAPEPPVEPAPTLAVKESSGDEVPAWDRDPTFAELKPDLEALEQAMAIAHGANTPIDDEPDDDASASPEDAEPAEDIPEITLDNSIRTGIEQHLAEDTGIELARRQPAQADAELEKIAAELAKAKTLEDVDDKMAETLFGSEISMIAAQVIGNPPVEEPANDPAPPPPPPPVSPAEMPPSTSITEEVSLDSQPPPPKSAMDLSASQRLKTVRALNADLPPSLREPKNDRVSDDSSEEPNSIEDQINTSITQTLKTLKVPPDFAIDDDDEESGKSGFFSRFRRS